jgi:hypothetical protein
VRIKAGEKPLIIFGHDECIYKQYLLIKKAWVLPSGEKQLVPKDEEQGIMISDLQSKEFGFSVLLTEQQFKEGLFIVEFEYGASNEEIHLP